MFTITKNTLWSPVPCHMYMTDELVIIIDPAFPKDIAVDFCSRSSWDEGELDMREMTGRGNVLGVLATVKAALEEYVSNNETPDTISFCGSTGKRSRVYGKYLKRLGYKFESDGSAFQVAV